MKSHTLTKLIATAVAAAALSAAGQPAIAAAPDAPSAVRSTPVTRIRALVNLHIRTGPSLHHHVAGKLWAGQTAAVTGLSDNYNWWRIRCPWGGTCWVSAAAYYSKPIAWRK